MINRWIVVLVATLLAVGCTSTVSPSGSGSEPQIAAVGEAYVVTLLDDERPFFDVRVDSVGPTGISRPVASFRDVRPAGWQDSMPYWDVVGAVGPTHLLPIVADTGDGGADTFRTLLLDLRPGGGPTVEVAGGGRTFWGPGGLLATEGTETEFIDPRTGAKTAVIPPIGTEIWPYWLADGSGWAASRLAQDESMTSGSLTIGGAFTPGPATLFQVTGRERITGAKGGQLSFSVSDGPESSESAIAEFRADLGGPCECLVWASRIEPGDDPAFGEAVWDAAGTGIWLVYTAKDRTWLSHLLEPKVDAPVAGLPLGPSWFIVGLSPDDHWIVLSAPELGSLVMVDTLAGTAREIARAQGQAATPTFAGWVR